MPRNRPQDYRVPGKPSSGLKASATGRRKSAKGRATAAKKGRNRRK